MRFLIISHALHKQLGNSLYAYAPYVREMNLWLNHVDEVEVIAPEFKHSITNLEMAYTREDIIFNTIPSIAFTSVIKSLNSIIKIPVILISIFKACRKADHIHLRCPGNIALLGCLIQIFFPKKTKTAKYAGNWDPNSKQPLSYRFQKLILSNTFLSKNIKVLVYGAWKNQSKNIKAFFTASFSEDDVVTPLKRDYNNEIRFVFIGSLVKGKNPLLAIKIVEAIQENKKAVLELYGDGILKDELQQYIADNNLEATIHLKGSQTKEVIQEVLKTSHFLILPSKSEGWPKAVAEAMFFGVIPIATKISCVPFMLDYGKRGILIEPNIDTAVESIKDQLKNKNNLETMSKFASRWSHNYTLEAFEKEIVKLLNQ
ncbi:glycosyltransferase family 4 protein [Flavivirga eckloniae]|uniref:Glycosyl transferase n=1 Tax=Flavivirga eckloniae TaxID=1803846 RepID=A0A2K9PMA9_9FLAO|nr:glycosyltransferase [Flavivirga eckloniae]AUP78166.1 glycosyl transferase [Flavivirga eckloniae]